MSINSLQSNPYAKLQSALETARERTGVQPQKAEVVDKKEEARVPRSAGGSLFQKIYGNSIEKKTAKPAQLGKRFDMYA